MALDSFWHEQLGRLQASLVEKASLYLIAKGPSQKPDLLDDDNRKYQNRAHDLYWDLMLTGFLWVPWGSPLQLSGAKLPSGFDVRSVGEMDSPQRTPGTPIAAIDQQRLSSAASLADTFPSLTGEKKHKRFWNITHSFSGGITSRLVEDRLHQFVRCIEGFIYPDIGKTERQFKSRTELFIGPCHHDLMGKLYELRSEVEHLHDPLFKLDAPTPRERIIALFCKAYEAEAIAQYCIERFLNCEDLWPHFQDDLALQQFWQLSLSDRETLWGDKLNIERVSKAFEGSLIRDEDIGLP